MKIKVFKKFPLSFRCIALAAVIMLSFTACSDDECTEFRTENLSKEITFIHFNGNETFKYLHNNTDTHTLKFFNKETYYIEEERSGGEGSCPTRYEAVKVSLLNQSTNQQYLFQYERDKSLFPEEPSPGAIGHKYAYFKFSGNNAFFFKELLQSSKDSTLVLGKKYRIGRIIGVDTSSNFIQYVNPIGIIRMVINGEKWELISE